MSETYLPLIAGLVGAIIGSFSSIATILIQSHYQRKRDLTRLSTEVAIEDFKYALEIAKAKGVKTRIPPVSLYVRYHFKYLTLLESGKLTPDDLKNFIEEHREFMSVLESLQR